MTRLAIAFSCAVVAFLYVDGVLAGPLEDGRLAIVHADQSVLVDDDDNRRPDDFLNKLREAGVLAIGRYYGRCRQTGFKHKLLVHGDVENAGDSDGEKARKRKSEAKAILDAGFAIISFYQYKTNDSNAGLKFTVGLPERHNLDPTECEQTDYAKTHPISRSATDEGALDASAAVAQAHAVGQRPNTPIYFGMDFDYEAVNKKYPSLGKGIVAYFKTVREILGKPENNYLIGAYGSGDMLQFLLGSDNSLNKERLIDFAWLSPSSGYSGTAKFTNSGRWHVLQSIFEVQNIYTLTSACVDYVHDGDIQNKQPGYEYAGAWNRSGRYVLPAERIQAIYDQHQFICAPRGVNPGVQLTSCRDHKAAAEPCSAAVCSARVVRVKPGESASSGAISIDTFGYGKFDGYAPASALSQKLTNRPHYSLDASKHDCN